ncbi:type VII secretion-associated protein [Pseudonocardia phyllosphaerae]|uniref:type VII secretion-associated protein n=1 Tax=Pseudonocardia phyllosphaerae TaxID=3390502 RepID=UPI003977FF1D
MTGFAAALHATPSALLLAAADTAGVTLLVGLPPGTAPATAVAEWLGDEPPDVVVLVGTAGGDTAGGDAAGGEALGADAALPGPPFPGDPRVLPVPFGAAVLATGAAPPDGPVLVVDADRGAAQVVDGARVTAVPLGPVAGAPGPRSAERDPPPGDPRADGIARAARGCRAVVLAGAHGGDPVLRDAVAARAGCPVRVAGPSVAPADPASVEGAGPATAAVLGAALLGAALSGAGLPAAVPAMSATAESGAGPESGADREPAAGPDPAADAEPERPGVAGRLRHHVLTAAALLGAALVVTGLVLGATTSATRTVPAAGRSVVQYGYATVLPDGWEHSGGDPARRRVLLTPAGRPDGAALLVVERSPLTYDATAEPARARRELAALLAGVPGVDGPWPRQVAGRPVLRYVQRDTTTVTDWHVVLDGADELVAGCRRPAGAPVPAACLDVVAGLRLTG